MFNLSKHPVTLSHMNLRAEIRGDIEVTMVDLKLTFETGNLLLEDLHAHLRASLYHGDAEPDLLGVDPGHTLHLRYPLLGLLRWGGDYGIELTLHLGSRKKDDVVFRDVKLNKIALDPKEGGTVGVTMRAQFEPSEEQIAKLAMLLHHEVRMSLVVLEEDTSPREPSPDDADEDGTDEDARREEALS